MAVQIYKSSSNSIYFKSPYNFSQQIGSSKRNVIFYYADKYNCGLILNIKSLKSTGSLCRIILFASSKFDFTPHILSFFKVNNVEIVFNANDQIANRSFSPHMLRYEFEYHWLLKHQHEVDRVFHSDAFDVFFQGDPFNSVSNESLTFIVEPHCFRSCGWNLAWINQCYGPVGAKLLNHRFIICSGSISGPTNEYIKFLKLLFEQPEWKTCWGPSLDQPIVNYIVWTGKAREAGIQYKLSGCDGGFLTMQWCVVDQLVLRNQHNQIISSYGSVPNYLHQYNRFQELSNQLFRLFF